METLTTVETTRLTELEIIIDHGLQTFVEVGNALLEIRDSRLYREQYPTFEEYCRERWNFTRMRASQLIAAAEVVSNVNNCLQIPANEAQARPLTKLTSQIQRTVWPIVVDTAPNGKITASHVQRVVDEYDHNLDAALDDEFRPACPQCGQVYNGDSCPDCQQKSRSMKPKMNYAGNAYVPQGMDACQTPAYAIDPILPYLQEGWTIWEPACGEGLLEGALYDSGFYVIPTDILTGQNFFKYEPENWDCLVTNPPFSIKYQWLERCYKLGKPFALLLPVETLGAKAAQEQFIQYGLEVIFLNRRVNFKMPKKGFDGSAAQFPVAWFTSGLNIGKQITFAKINEGEE